MTKLIYYQLLFVIVLMMSLETSTYAQSASNRNFLLFQQPSISEANIAVEERELIKARKANEEAQAEYYRLQTEKLQAQSTSQNIWQKPVDNPALLGAVIAAFVALLSFIFNYLATLQNQRDTQFYEALKRFGDKDSPILRSSAVGLLTQMAKKKAQLLRWRRPYFDTVIGQFSTGMLLEDNIIVNTSIVDGIQELSFIKPRKVSWKLWDINLKLQEDMLQSLAEYGMAISVESLEVFLSEVKVVDKGEDEEISEEDLNEEQSIESIAAVIGKKLDRLDESVWDELEAITGYSKRVLFDLIRKSYEKFSGFARSASQGIKTISPEKKDEHLAMIRQKLQTAASRLQMNVKAFSASLDSQFIESTFAALHGIFPPFLAWAFLPQRWVMGIFLVEVSTFQADLRGAYLTGALLHQADLHHAQLQGANLLGARLQEADLRESRFQGADLQHVNLEKAQLWGSKINKKTKMDDTNWWSANFFRDEQAGDKTIDTNLLEELYSRYEKVLPKSLRKLHPSVRLFLKVKRQIKQAPVELAK